MLLNKKIKSFFFDLDGTLLRSGPDLMTSVNHVLKQQNMKPILDDIIIGNLVGGGAAKMLEKAFKFYNKNIDELEMPKLVEDFISFYEKNCSVKSSLYNNVEQTLKKLVKHEMKLCICTNKRQFLAEKVLDEFNISQNFFYILGSQSKLELKPNVQMLKFLKEKVDLPFENIAMVGDSNNDIEPANKLGMQSIFVNYGYGKIEDFKPSIEINSFEKILDYV